MTYYTYIFYDPKKGTPCYVGKGKGSRWRHHFSKPSNPRLGNLIKKRLAEGFSMDPLIIPAASNEDAVEMEMLLIAMLGRIDMNTGCLFNLTDGGEGIPGKTCSEAERKLISDRARLAAKRPEVLAAWKKRSADPEFKKRNAEAHQRACTVDGINIFPSVKHMIKELGQGKNGTRSPSFRFISGDRPSA